MLASTPPQARIGTTYCGPAQVIRGLGGSIGVDLTQIPGNPPRPVIPGETWNCQCWSRDVDAAGNSTSSFTNGVSVLLR